MSCWTCGNIRAVFDLILDSYNQKMFQFFRAFPEILRLLFLKVIDENLKLASSLLQIPFTEKEAQ